MSKLNMMLLFIVVNLASGTVITFEDLYPSLSKSSTNSTPSNYAGFNWSSKFRLMTTELANTGTSGVGYSNGMVGNVVSYTAGPSGSNAVELSSNELFNFTGAYITSAWKTNQDVQLKGYHGNQILYIETIYTSSDQPYWFDFNFNGIDRLSIVPGIGGEDIYYNYRGNHIAIDNITLVPEPCSLALLSFGGLATIRKRK